jgi:uncharacterized protein HemY
VDEGLWGKAEGYLRVALRGPLAAQAHCALAVLYEQTDRGALASRHYREAAQLELDWRAPAAEGSAVDHAPQA